ncbi:MAG: hypothetical protein ABI664_23665, partial [bacterium]
MPGMRRSQTTASTPPVRAASSAATASAAATTLKPRIFPNASMPLRSAGSSSTNRSRMPANGERSVNGVFSFG